MSTHCLVTALVLIAAPLGAAAIAPEAAAGGSPAPPAPPSTRGAPMTLDRLDALIRRVDAAAVREGPGWQLSVDGTSVQVIADARHDRMRIVVPVAKAEDVSQAMLHRCMQANFSTALDARYAIARGVLWSAFVHPLGSLDEALFLSALGQTVTLARSYGTTFQSGELLFGGGDLLEPRAPGGGAPDPGP